MKPILPLGLALCLAATPALADTWTVRLDIQGGASHAQQGTLNTLDPLPGTPTYMSSEAFAVGVDSGRPCTEIDEFEIDFYFGETDVYAGHLLFTLVVGGAGSRALEPAIFYDEMKAGDEPERSFLTFNRASINVDRMACRSDGGLDLGVTFKGTLDDLNEEAPEIQVSGRAEAALLLLDMSNY